MSDLPKGWQYLHSNGQLYIVDEESSKLYLVDGQYMIEVEVMDLPTKESKDDE